ncbi:MAG: PIN domain-containing protein [Actinobacteria bacterium]|nr:PIN domain-containing protein [Actinomycetota bacterium]
MQNILLDTNALVFYLAASERFGRKSIRTLDNSNLFFSPLSLVELKLKALRGKFKGTITSKDLDALGMKELRIGSEVVDEIIKLDTSDPFDLMLIAQAKAAGYTFMTADSKILNAELDFVLDLSD